MSETHVEESELLRLELNRARVALEQAQAKTEIDKITMDNFLGQLEQKDKRIAELEHQIVLRDNLHRTSLEAISKRLNEVLCKATT